LKRVLSISRLILPLLALASAPWLSAQTIVVDKPTLALQGQVGGSPVTQTINVTSSDGSAMAFTLSYTSSPWLKANGQSFGLAGTTPAAVVISADPTGLPAETLTANIVVQGGSSAVSPIAVTFRISAIAVNPSSYTFTYTVGGTVPPQQSFNISGANNVCTVAPTADINWFTYLVNPTCTTLTVSMTNIVNSGLAPRTYSGSLAFLPVPAGTDPSAVLSLTLNVVPAPPVTFDPASGLIFNYQTGIGAPNPTQTLNVYASQPLTVGVTTHVNNFGTWSLSPNPLNGTISATTGSLAIAVTVNPNGVAAGTYTGSLTLLTPGGSPTQQDVPVKLVVSSTPLLNVPNNTLNFVYQLTTSAPAAQSVNITSTGSLLSYTVTPSNYVPTAYTSWLSVNTSGTTAAPLNISVTPAGLPVGRYTATINVSPPTQGSTAQQIPVVLTVTNDPTISASVNSLSFPYQVGQSTPAARSVKLTSSTGVPLNYTASLATTTCTGSTWLLAANANNSLSGVANPTDTLTVSVTTTGLTAANSPCTGTITITATNPATGTAAVGSPISIPVTLLISTTAQLVLTPPDPPLFTAGVGSPSPAPQPITLSSTNSDVLTYTVAIQPQGSWLSVNTVGGSTSTGNNSITLSVNSAGLVAGTYNGTVTVTATGPGGAAVADSPVNIPVTLTVTTGSLTVSASDLTFPDQTLGGPAPASQTVTIGSTGQPLNYTAVANGNTSVNWLSVSPASGNTSTSGTLTVSVDGSKLTAGTYTGSIQLTSPGAGNSPTINVHFKVNPGTFAATPTTLTFAEVAGGTAPAAQSVAVSGSVPLNFTVATSTQNGGSWLKATPASGTTSANVQVSIDSTVALGVGQYFGSVTITSAGASGSPATVQVVLNVTAPAVLSASPTTLSFGYIIGLAVPPSQNLLVSATGATGAVPLTAQVQYDIAGQTWLAVSPATGNAPATFAVSVSTTGLAAGTYTGKVIVSSANALSPATTAVTLVVTAIPKPVITGVTNAANYSTGAVSPGENVAIFGVGIGPATLAYGTVVNSAFTTVAGNTRVLFDNVPAPVYYSSTGQTSVWVPYGVNGRTSTNIVVEYFGVQSAPVSYNVVATVPGIYTLNQQGTGPGAILNQDGITINSVSAPEKRGNVIAIYMTGEGQTNPGGVDGAIIPPVASALKYPILPVTVTIGGVDAVVAYAGSAAGEVSGLMQVNVIIPLTAPTGTQPVVVTVGTAKSQSGASAATVAVQ
jgi:uncharacterized protein (TIGR03437 family)